MTTVDVRPDLQPPAQERTEQDERGWIQPVPQLVDPLGLAGDLVGQWVSLPVNAAAFILQSMHPVIGDVVTRYSVADTDPLGRGIRSFDAVLQWFFGGKAAIEQGYWLRKMHQPLQMTGENGTATGKHISALDPEAYGWVIATAFASAVWSAPLMLGRAFTDEEEEQVFRDVRLVARNTQVPERHFPASREEFWVYYHRMVDEVLINHPFLREQTQLLRNPDLNIQNTPALRKVPAWARPLVARPLRSAVRLGYLLLFGVLAPEIRAILEVGWDKQDEKQLQRLFRGYRTLFRILPERVTYAPLAYHARKHQRIINTMRRRELDDFTAHDKAKAAGCPF